MKFGVAVTAGKNPTMGVERGLKASTMGFHAAYSFDHFFFPVPSVRANQMECWTTLTTIAAKTERLRVGPLVLSLGYRNPGLVAKMAATLDNLSNGRLILGIGAGWLKAEYEAYGIPFPSFSTRMEQLEEALRILRIMWTQDEPSFEGKHFQIRNAYCNPKPLQNPLPIVLGGNNEKELLTLAGKYANVYNALWVSPKDCQRKYKLLEEQEQAAGRKKKSVTRSFFTNIFLVKSDAEREQLIDTMWSPASKQTRDAWAEGRIIGTVDEAIKQIEAYQRAGAQEMILLFADKEPDFVQMGVFNREIIPSFI